MDSISQPYALLLLPPPPSSSFARLRAAYGPGLAAVYSKLSTALDGANRIALLDVALPVPGVLSTRCQPRARVFQSLQRLLASFYTLVGVVCAAANIELDGPGGVDTRVFFVDYDPARGPAPQDAHEGASNQGPVIDLQTLAACARPWDDIYTFETREGKELAAAFSAHLRSQAGNSQLPKFATVPSGEEWNPSHDLLITDDSQSARHYSVAVGGTWDHLHVGHKLLLTATALALDPLSDPSQSKERLMTIGVTGDELLVNKKYAEFLESWEERWQGAASFLNAIIDFSPPENHIANIQRASNPEPNGKYVLVKVTPDLSLKFVQISDPFGPTITDPGITALVVSQETRAGGKAVNDERAKKRWPSLDIFEVDVLHSGEVAETADSTAASFESKISSTDIRRRRMEMAKGNL